jgi:hypothetical protein
MPIPKHATNQMHYAIKTLAPILLLSLALFIITSLMVTDALFFDGRRRPDSGRILADLTEIRRSYTTIDI